MQKMGGFPDPHTGKKFEAESSSVRFNIPEEQDHYVLEIEDFDVEEGSDATAAIQDKEDQQVTLLPETLEKTSSYSRVEHKDSLELYRSASIPNIPRLTDCSALFALKILVFIRKIDGWPDVENRFYELSLGGSLDRSLLGRCIGITAPKVFEQEFFDVLVWNRITIVESESITIGDLKQIWEQISEDLFDIVVENTASGICRDDLKEIIALSASENRLPRIVEHAIEYAGHIMEELDPDERGYIEIYSLETMLIHARTLLEREAQENRRLGEVLGQEIKSNKVYKPIQRWYKKTIFFLEDNWKRIWLLLFWFSICGGLFTYKFIQYKNRAVYHVMGYCICTAKGAAETLKFNMALVLLPVCRNTLTWLRNRTNLGTIVPFDDNISFHEVISVGIVAGVGLHAGAHLTCNFPRLLHATKEEYEPMKPYFGKESPPNYWWFIKGVEGVTGITITILMIIAFTLAISSFRRSYFYRWRPLRKLVGFNAFWYCHHLFIMVYAILLVHGFNLYLTKEWYKKTTWMYVTIPVLLYACERLIRAFRSVMAPVKIIKAVIHPGNVLVLHLSKPHGFNYISGQYILVNCASLSLFEWHPFYITSAPAEDFLSVHVRVLGDWTSDLKKVISEYLYRGAYQMCRIPLTGEGLLVAEHIEGQDDNLSFPRVLIDGPFGAAPQDYRKYEVVLVISLGIGVAPYISILKDMVNNMKVEEEEEGNGGREVKKKQKQRGLKTKRVYFYWVTREQGSFDWFKGAMNEVSEANYKGVIELHNYCTSIYEEGDSRSVLIAMLQSLTHRDSGLDIVSGTRVKTHFSKPNWFNVFKMIAIRNKDTQVGVFYTGAPVLRQELLQLAAYFSRKTSTKFEFHNDNM